MRNHPESYVHTDPTPTVAISLVAIRFNCECLCHTIGTYAQANCRNCNHNY